MNNLRLTGRTVTLKESHLKFIILQIIDTAITDNRPISRGTENTVDFDKEKNND